MARALRVGFDGRALDAPAAGVRRYAGALLQALRRISPATEIVAVGVTERTPTPDGVIRIPAGRSLPTNAGWMLAGIPLAIRGLDLDVFHAPAYTAPLAWTPPIVLTVHDVSYARRPGDYPYRRDPLRRSFYRASIRRAAAIITDSRFSARELEAAYGVPESDVTVAPLAADARFCPSDAPAHGWPTVADPYVLHVGDLHPRRRVGLLVDATLRLRAREAALAGLTLVLIGRDHGEGRDAQHRAAAAGAPAAVRLLGVQPDDVLVDAMRGAAAFVYASRYEGFGLPVLEAMACGTPVVAVADASIPEIVGEAGRLVRDAAPEAFADALAGVLLSGDERRRLAQAGRARAATFTWDRTAEQTLAVYERVAGGRAA